MGKRRKNLFDNMFDRLDDVSRDVRKAGRRAVKSKKRKKGSSRKWAKRNNRELEALTEQMSLLVKHLSRQPGSGISEDTRVSK
jgi:hypothetical protein